MWSIAFRWLPRRLLDSLRSPMMWSIARRCSSRFCRRCSSTATCARSRRSTAAAAAVPGSLMAASSLAVVLCGITQILPVGSNAELPPKALQLLLESDHLQLPTDDDFLELFQVEDLLLQLAFRLLEVPNDLLVLAHVAQNADRADHLPVRVAQRRRVECGGN